MNFSTLVLGTTNDNSFLPLGRSESHDKNGHATDDGDTFSINAGYRFTRLLQSKAIEYFYSINLKGVTELGQIPGTEAAQNYNGRRADILRLGAQRTIEKSIANNPKLKLAMSGSAHVFGVGNYGGLELQQGFHKAIPFINSRFERYSDLLQTSSPSVAMSEGIQDKYPEHNEVGVDLGLAFKLSYLLNDKYTLSSGIGLRGPIASFGETTSYANLELAITSQPDSRLSLAMLIKYNKRKGDYLAFYPEGEGLTGNYRLSWDKLFKKSILSVHFTGVAKGEGASRMLLTLNRPLGGHKPSFHALPIISDIQ